MTFFARCSLLILAAVLARTPALARQTSDAFLAPANRWTTAGGGLARSGATRTRAVRGPVEIAWAFAVDGTIEGEPLCWDDLVVVTSKRGNNRRTLRVLDLFSGEPVVPPVNVATQQPLSPSMWRNVIAYRASPTQLVAMRVGKSRMSEMWSRRAETSASAPLLVANRVYAAVDGALSCFVIGNRTPLWSTPGGFVGAVAMNGERVFGVLKAEGGGRLEVLDANTGAILEHCPSFEHLAVGSDALVALLPCGPFAGLVGSPDARDGRTLVRGFGYPDARGAPPPSLGLSSFMRTLPSACGAGWIAKVQPPNETLSLALCSQIESTQILELASSKHNAEFVTDELPITIAGPVAYAGARAFELESGRVLWKMPLAATERAVPARETVLIVDGGKRLVAVRARATEPIAATSSGAPPREVAGTLVLRDGSIESGVFAVDDAAASISRTAGTDKTPWRAADVLLLEDASKGVVCGVDPLRGLEFLCESSLTTQYVELLKKARPTNDPALIGEVIDAALLHGADPKDVESAQQYVDGLRARKTPAQARADKVKDVRDDLAFVAGSPIEFLLHRFLALPQERRAALDTKLLRAMLALDANDKRVRELVRSMIPESFKPGGDFDPLDALTFIEATRRTPVTLVAAPVKDSADLDYAGKQIGWRLSTWRKDLYGVRSKNLLIITPVKKLGTLARALAVGELVCEMLRQIVAAGAEPRDERWPMVIELFATRDEYLQRSDHGRGGHAGGGLEWTAGHYDMRDNVSRFYFPDSDEELDQVLTVATHELTHHWLRSRCPLWPYRPLDEADVTQPGFWIVEGFATFVEDFGLDVERGTWSLGGSTSYALDLLANAGENALPWELEFGLSFAAFQDVPLDKSTTVQSSMYLGKLRPITARSLFYAQAAATARYLYEADGGVLRPKLMEFLRAYYTNDAKSLDVAKLAGVDAKSLGARITELARRIVEQP